MTDLSNRYSGEQLSLEDERELELELDRVHVDKLTAELESELGARRVYLLPCGCYQPAAETCAHGYVADRQGNAAYDPATAPFPEGF